jgi:hypothetical protein
MEIIPRLRKLGYRVERTKRPLSRGVKYRVYKPPDTTIAVVYSRGELKEVAAAIFQGKEMPAPWPYSPAGKRSSFVKECNRGKSCI